VPGAPLPVISTEYPVTAVPPAGRGTGDHLMSRAPGVVAEGSTWTPVGAAGTKSARYGSLGALGSLGPTALTATTEKRNVCSGSRSESVHTVDSPQSLE
jgi:hypothetical protein